MTHMNNHTIGRYTVSEKLGEGGMGIVYRARDSELGRDVAIKMLPDEYSSDPERLERLRREARSAAALNHPGICTIYEVGRTEDSSFISMEFVEGVTLSERIANQPLPPESIIRYGTDLAAAIEHAHQKGVIHRDLKSSNVIITPDDHAKVLDFGLAKPTLTEELSDLSQSVMTLTEIGTAVGTLPYMAPEVLRGEAADQQSDIWSLGVMLYEMAAGELPFSGQTGYELSSSILTQTPSPLPPDIPIGLQDVIGRCLSKESARRYNSTAEILTDLVMATSANSIRQRFSSFKIFLQSIPSPIRYGIFAVGTVALALLLIGTLTVEPAALPDRIHLANSEIAEYRPTISSNGDRIGFIKNGTLYVTNMNVGVPVPIHENISDAKYSPDGTQFACMRFDRSRGLYQLFLLPEMGGDEWPLTDFKPNTNAVRGIYDWAPDGTYIAISDTIKGSHVTAIFKLNIASGEPIQLTFPPPDITGDLMPRVSPDGTKLAFLRQDSAYFQRRLYIKDLNHPTRAPRPIIDTRTIIYGYDWAPDNKGLIISSPRDQLLWIRLWWVSARSGKWRALSFGENAREIQIATESNRLVFESLPFDWHVYKISGPANSGFHPAERFTLSHPFTTLPVYSPNGELVAMQAAGRTGMNEICVFTSAGELLRSVTPGFNGMHAGWSLDGEYLSFTRDPLFNPRISIVKVEGGPAEEFFNLERFSGHASWSHDENWIYYEYKFEGEPQTNIYKKPRDGGDSIQLTFEYGRNPIESDDGMYIYYHHPASNCIRRVPVNGGVEEVVFDHRIFSVDWTIWNDNLVYINNLANIGELSTIQMYHIGTGQISHIADMPNDFTGQNFGFTVSPDGQWILYGDQKNNSDVIGLDNVVLRRPRR
ncbi:protein kinase [Gemmatimonadota bacterium]